MSDYSLLFDILPAGDSALVLQFEKRIDDKISAMVFAAKKQLEHASLPFIKEMIQTYCSLLVYYDPLIVGFEEAKAAIFSLLGNIDFENNAASSRLITIPVCYADEFAPDIDFVCSHCRLSKSEVIKLHTQPDYRIFMMGFLPGFPYLGGMDEKLATPRLSSPRTKIEPGSVGIAQNQTGIYPLASPGGWQIIGRTPLRLYDKNAASPILLHPGEFLRFRSISRVEYDRILALIESGSYRLEESEVSLS